MQDPAVIGQYETAVLVGVCVLEMCSAIKNHDHFILTCRRWRHPKASLPPSWPQGESETQRPELCTCLRHEGSERDEQEAAPLPNWLQR